MNKKRLLAVLLAVVMVVSMVAVLVACEDNNKAKTFEINWSNYLQDLADIYGQNNKHLPNISQKTFEDNVVVNTSYANNGLLVLTDTDTYVCTGYSIVSNKVFGTYDNLYSLSHNGYHTFMGTTQAGGHVLYDILGDEVASGKDISVSSTSITIDGKTTQYLEIEVDETVFYREVLEDYCLGSKLSNLPTAEESKLPGVGETFTSRPTSLAEWFKVDEKETDSYLENVYVRKFGSTAVFFDQDEAEISRLTMPLNIDKLAYVDGHILYSTLTPVDPQATKGFNYVSDGSKYLAQLYSFDIATGKTAKLNVNYVLASSYGAMYNLTSKSHDVLSVAVYRMVDGIAWEDYADTLLINAEGAIGFSNHDSLYGVPAAKVGSNYLTASGNIINSDNELVANIGSISRVQQLLSDGFAIVLDGKLGVIGFDGKVKVGFNYSLINSSYICGDLAYVQDEDGKRYALNLSTGATRTLSSIAGVDDDDITLVSSGYLPGVVFIRTYNEYSNTYTYRNIDGFEISNVTSSNLFYYNYNITAGDYTYCLISVPVKTANGTQTAYLRIVV